jgi:glycosyltransferase involved in cell wall biosynthesis
MNQIEHILFFAKIEPFPPHGGEKIRCIELIKLFSSYAQKLTVLCPQVPGETDYGIPQNVDFVQLMKKNRGKISQSIVNRTGYFVRDQDTENQINQINNNQKIQWAVVDYGFIGHYIPFLRKLGVAKIIYVTHNSESELTKQEKKDSLVGQLSQKLKYQLQKRHERQYFNQADHLIVVSKEDAAFHSAFVDTPKIIIMPNFLDSQLYEFKALQLAERNREIVMVANFLSFQNIAGAGWFLKEVWDDDLSSSFQLSLVGLGSKRFLAEFSSDHFSPKNCVAEGEVDDIKNTVSACICTVVPLLHGSGLRFKLLETMALGTPVVSTSKGAEGINHEGSIKIADDAGSFKKMVSDIVSMTAEEYSDLTKQLRSVFEKRYSHQANKKILDQTFFPNNERQMEVS